MQPLIDPAQILQPAAAMLGVDLRGWALAWARVTPALTLVPAFGLNALPAPTRAALGLALAVSIAPSLAPAQLSAPFAVNQIVHRSNNRLDHDLALCEKHKVPMIITSLGARAALPSRVSLPVWRCLGLPCSRRHSAGSRR